jgi:hypothetical protein
VRRALVVLAFAGLAGCYDPSYRNCTVACAQASECSPDQICGADGWCAAPDVAGRCEGIRDAEPDALPPDADVTDSPAPDASTSCEEVCDAGTCVDGVCTIDCSGDEACRGFEVTCPAGVPCHVICGDLACDKHVDCTLATACVIECVGVDACHEEVRCGTGPCDVTCSGFKSCGKKTKCADSCSCDVRCAGLEACHDPSECPAAACVFGNGCTSDPLGCDQCGG